MYGQVTLQNSADVEFRYSAEKNTKLGELNDIQGQLKTELEAEDKLRNDTNLLNSERNAAQTQMNKTIDNLEQLKQVKAEDQDKTIIQSDIKDLEEKMGS